MYDLKSKIKYGYCHCGCGNETTVSKQNHKRYGWIKGVPLRYRQGHNSVERIGAKNSRWTGDNFTYRGLHQWIVLKKGKATICEKCESNYCVGWSNISGEYKRDIDDFMALCIRCHRKKDGWYNKMHKIRFGKEYKVKPLHT